MSDIEFIEFRKKFNLDDLNFKILDSLPDGNISIGASIQYLDLIEPVKKYLEEKGRKVVVKNGSYYKGQVLGCNSNAFDKSCDVLILLCDGKFHALNNAIFLKKEIYVFNGYSLDQITLDEINEQIKKTKEKQMKFLNSKNIGLLVSNKEGQYSRGAFKIKKEIEKLNKNVYVFFGDLLDLNEFENFPKIDIWVNSACYGLGIDSLKIINLSDIIEFFN